jgi:hypothetical protein
MTDLIFDRDGWACGASEDEDQATLTRLRIAVGSAVLTRTYNKRGGGESETLNIPLFPLAQHLAKMWWPLLFEPQRPNSGESFIARHRLDMPMHGYVFPPLALCSAGDEALLVDWTQDSDPHSPFEFRTAPPREPVQIARGQAEPVLMDIVATALARLNRSSSAFVQLAEDWSRVTETMSNPGELQYSMAAGRLGLDPYDPDAPDVTALTSDLPPDLFNDISDAIGLRQVAKAAEWTSEARVRLKDCPEVEVGAFGQAPADDLGQPAWKIGVRAANALRKRLNLSSERPAEGVAEMLCDAVWQSNALSHNGPPEVRSLVQRTNGKAYIGAISRSARQQRFGACAAVYVAWCSEPGDERAGTVALTRRQQAGRAFAAEMLAPQDYLRERAGRWGFTSEDIEDAAGDLIAPFQTVQWQAYRAGVDLWDVDLSRPPRGGIFAVADDRS